MSKLILFGGYAKAFLTEEAVSQRMKIWGTDAVMTPRRNGFGPSGARALAPRLASDCVRSHDAAAGRDPGRWTVRVASLMERRSFFREVEDLMSKPSESNLDFAK